MRLIDKDALIEKLTSYAWNEKVSIEVLDMICGFPPAPVVHGHWVRFNVVETKDCSSKIRYMCNKCGRYEDEQEPYCNCGAKMDGGGEK